MLGDDPPVRKPPYRSALGNAVARRAPTAPTYARGAVDAMSRREVDVKRQVFMRPDAKDLTDPFSYGVRWGDILFVGAQSPAFDAHGLEAQARSVLEKVGVVLRLAGTDYPYVLKCGIFLRDMNNFGPFNKIFREFFPKDFPARATIEANSLSARILVAMDCIAGIPDPGPTT